MRELTVLSRYSGQFHVDHYNCTPRSLMHSTALFATRDDAIDEAERLLVLDEKHHEKANARLTRLRAAVAKLKGGAR